MRRARLRAAWCAWTIALALPSVARGEGPAPPEPPRADTPEAPEVTEAREAFRLGSALAKEGQWLDALASFQRSARLKPHPTTTYNIGYCERALGHFARAYQAFVRALEPPASPDGPTLTADIADEARAYQAEVERRVSRVTVTLGEPDVAVRVDGMRLEAVRRAGGSDVFVTAADDSVAAPALPSSFELWLDPGSHVFLVSRPDGERIVETHVAAAGASTALRLAVATTTPSPPAAPRPAPERVVAVPHAPNRLPAFVAFGAGAAGLVAGGVFAGLALHEKGALDADPRCRDGHCPDEASYRDREGRMQLFADLATAGVLVGVVGAGVGTYLWLSEDGESRTARVRPFIGVGAAGVRGRF